MLFPMDIGIDLGTASILVYAKKKGVVLQEPTVVAIEKKTRKILAVGEEAQRMIGRTPGNIVAIRPLHNGVIADYDITEAMLKHFISKVCGRRILFKPRIMVCIPSGVTTVEKRAVLEAAVRAGARKTYLIEEPLAAALGAGLDISEPSGNMVIDVGGGTTDIAVLSLGGVVLSESLRVGGDHLDDSLIRYIKRVYNLLIGVRTAEQVKISIGTADPGGRQKTTEVRGRDLVHGLPKIIKLTSEETLEAMLEPISSIINGVRVVLEKTPPELAADIMDKGIVMTGGGTLLHGLDKRLAKETGIPINIAEDPVSCVVKGTGMALDCLEDIKGQVMSIGRVASSL
jgi:rod shape-determining protein MreB